MSTTQKIIKYLAIIFAFSLIFGIITGVIGGISHLVNDGRKNNTTTMKDIENSEDVAILNVDCKATNINILEGDTFKAETNNKYISVKQYNNKILIKERNHSWFSNDNYDLNIYVPSNMIFEDVTIDTGAGKITIDSLKTKNLDLDLGVGKTSIDELTVLNSADIDTGAGNVVISNGNINNLDLDLGVGKVELTAKITGNSKIDSGVGEVTLNLIGNNSFYSLIADKGLGSITLNNKDIIENTYYGEGLNKIRINGGVGNIKIKYIEQE
mgnify:CR=1 FL=1